MSIHICTTDPLATIDSIMSAFQSHVPPGLPTLPKFLPSVPSPMYGTIKMPNTEMLVAAIELQAYQLQNTLLAMIRPMLSLLAMDINSFIPDIPGLPGFNLMSLLEDNAAAMLAAVKAALASGLVIPGIPDPFFATILAPEIRALHALQAIISNYMQTIANLLPALIKKVTDKLVISAMPTLPTLPSPAAILAAIEAAIASGLDNLASKIMGISFPGMPSFPAIQIPLVVAMNVPQIDLIHYLNMLKNNLLIGLLTPIMHFINTVLSAFLSFTFPKMCVTIG